MRAHSTRSSSGVVCCRPVCTPKRVLVMSSERSRVRETPSMPRASVATTSPDRIDVEYETIGSADDPALLLVMGFGAQLIAWDDGFCQALADRGRYVIRYDNRDAGLSTHFDGVKVNAQAVLRAQLDGTLPPAV